MLAWLYFTAEDTLQHSAYAFAIVSEYIAKQAIAGPAPQQQQSTLGAPPQHLRQQ